jgi:acyl dehydratase
MSLELALADLQTKLNSETHVSDWLTITQDRINQFADATLDRQWIHVDVKKASAESPFGAPVAHGFLTLSLIPFLSGNVDPDKPRYAGIKLGVNYGMNKVRFPSPVLVGSRVRARVILQSVEEVRGNGLQIISQVTIEIEGNSKPACVAETVSRMYF